MTKAIIFDIEGVLLKSSSDDVMRKLSYKLGISQKEFMDFYNKFKGDLLRGNLTHIQFIDKINEKFGVDEDILSRWTESYLIKMALDKDILFVIERLKHKHTIACISNMNDLHEQICVDKGYFMYFEPNIVSSQVGMMKPEKDIYKIIPNKLETSPKECILIEPNPKFIDFERSLGFDVIRYQDALQLNQELMKRGL